MTNKETRELYLKLEMYENLSEEEFLERLNKSFEEHPEIRNFHFFHSLIVCLWIPNESDFRFALPETIDLMIPETVDDLESFLNKNGFYCNKIVEDYEVSYDDTLYWIERK